MLLRLHSALHFDVRVYVLLAHTPLASVRTSYACIWHLKPFGVKTKLWSPPSRIAA